MPKNLAGNSGNGWLNIKWSVTFFVACIVAICTIVGTTKFFVDTIAADLDQHLKTGAHFDAAKDIAEIKADINWIKYHLKKREGRHGI